jgi:hypothetical protein
LHKIFNPFRVLWIVGRNTLYEHKVPNGTCGEFRRNSIVAGKKNLPNKSPSAAGVQ